MKHDCDICNGSGIINLPRHRQLSSMRLDADAVPAEEAFDNAYGTYPCPECSPATPVKIGTVRMFSEFELMKGEEGAFLDHARRNIAHKMGMHLLKEGLIRFEKTKVSYEDDPPYARGRQELRATLGVYTPAATMAFESAVTERQEEIAAEIAREAEAEILSFGPSDLINKVMAVEFVRDAVSEVLCRRQKKWT